MNSIRYGATVGAFVIGLATTANAADRLTLYCSPQEEWCQIMVTAFEKETGIEVAMTRKSSGETYAQISGREGQSRRATSGGAAPAIRTCRRPRRG